MPQRSTMDLHTDSKPEPGSTVEDDDDDNDNDNGSSNVTYAENQQRFATTNPRIHNLQHANAIRRASDGQIGLQSKSLGVNGPTSTNHNANQLTLNKHAMLMRSKSTSGTTGSLGPKTSPAGSLGRTEPWYDLCFVFVYVLFIWSSR